MRMEIGDYALGKDMSCCFVCVAQKMVVDGGWCHRIVCVRVELDGWLVDRCVVSMRVGMRVMRVCIMCVCACVWERQDAR